MKKSVIAIALTSLALLSCNDVGTNPEKASTSQSSSALSSNANSSEQVSSSSLAYDPLDPSTWNLSSSSQSNPDTLLLSDIGSPKVSVFFNTAKESKLSAISTATIKFISDSSVKIDYDVKEDGDWLGGNTMIVLEYSISSEIDFHNIFGIHINSVFADSVLNVGGNWEIVSIPTAPYIDTVYSDKRTLLLPSFYGFFYESSTGGVIDTRKGGDRPSPYTDSNGDGWVYNILDQFDHYSYLTYQQCVDGLCTPMFCTETSCGVSKLSFYFWTPKGTGSMTINGMSLITQ